MLAFFFSVVRFLEASFFATFFFVREPGFFAPIAVATYRDACYGSLFAAEIQHPAEDHPILRLTPTGWNLRQGQALT
jgi:hypothetical protein